jgi:protein ImuB
MTGRPGSAAAEGDIERILVARCPDWPVVAAGVDESVPAIVVASNRVVALSAAAREEGVREGLRRREAQGRCPTLEVVEADPAREARFWLPLVEAVEAFAPGVEIVAPGTVALATRGPSRYFGGDAALAERVGVTLDTLLGRRCVRVGVADGRFTAGLASRSPETSQATSAPVVSAAGFSALRHPARPPGIGPGPLAPVIVPRGESRAWLAPLPVGVLGRPELSGLLVRLGIRTLSELADLPASILLARFGPEGALAHRLARGLEEQPLAARTPPRDLGVAAELDPPAERVDHAAFVAKALAEEFHQQLAIRGLACTGVLIEAETEHGERLSRRWRHDGGLSAGAVVERVRWQLDSWLTDRDRRSLPLDDRAPEDPAPGDPVTPAEGTTGGLTLLRLTPEEVRPDHGRQLGFWGGVAAGDDRMARALARVQGMLGPDEVLTAVVGGGRDPAEQVRMVPWGDPREVDSPPEQPWPGRLPGPAPAVVYQPPVVTSVLDARDRPVTVDGRGTASAAPSGVVVEGGRREVLGWNGPWPVEERWWDPAGRRRARFQVLLDDGSAHLVVREGGRWWLEATYD